MKQKDDLIYDLIFSDKVDFTINILDYIENLYKYDRFINEIKTILKKSKVDIIKEGVNIDIKSITWRIKVNK